MSWCSLRLLSHLLPLALLASCASKTPAPQVAAPNTVGPALVAAGFRPLKMETGVLFREDTLASQERVWLYVPKGAPPPEGWPVVLVAPAGSSLLTGMRLSERDRPEHLPYVRAGYVTIAYDVAGALPEGADEAAAGQAMKAFFLSGMGVESAGLALQHGQEALPLNLEQVYAAGHSSAATLALQLGGASPNIKGVIAFAPVTNLVSFMRKNFPDLIQNEGNGSSEMTKLLTVLSPIALAAQLRKPVFLFHASTDTTVSVQESQQLYQLLHALGMPVTYREVDHGDHYDSMIREGLPAAVAWLKTVSVP